eukprot:UN12594
MLFWSTKASFFFLLNLRSYFLINHETTEIKQIMSLSEKIQQEPQNFLETQMLSVKKTSQSRKSFRFHLR